MKLIIGLGNQGENYKKTRHNIGFRTLDYFQKKNNSTPWHMDKKFNSLISFANINSEKIILAKPQTFMNNSGQAVSGLVSYYKIKTEDIIVIHDDIDLLSEQIKIQANRGAAGHKGVESIIKQLGDKNFTRIRIGINPKEKEEKIDTEKFVLEKFSQKEEERIEQTMEKAANLLLTAL